MPFIIDASVVLARPLGDCNSTAELALTRLEQEEALAPAQWWFEVRNVIVVNERRGRITELASTGFLRDLSRLAILLDRSPDEATVMALARRHRLTVYDAAYLELALREGLPLATLDTALAEAARREGVDVLGDAT